MILQLNDLSSWNPDGYFISNGPGDPEPLSSAINLAKEILNINKPLVWNLFRSSSNCFS